MNTRATLIICSVAFVSCCLVQQSPAGAQRVIVNNARANPVPVTVQNSVNAATSAADNPAFQPYSQQAQTTSSSSTSYAINFAVPAGKRLVIEYVSAFAALPSGENVRVDVAVYNGDNTFSDFSLVRNALGSDNNGHDLFNVGQSLRLYSSSRTVATDPSVSVNFTRSDNTGEMLVSAAISGYLVDIP